MDVWDAWLGLLTALLLAFGVPAAGWCAASWAYGAQSQSRREQQRSRHAVTAVLTRDVPVHQPQGDGVVDRYPTTVRWRAPDGSVRTGRTAVDAGKRKGSRITVWVLDDGRLTDKPLGHGGVLVASTAAALLAATGAGTTVSAVFWQVRRRLDRRRSDAWAQEWAEVGPVWCRGAG
ncbi:hypothetical protein [Streptomyces sp. MST-110588]|uniref:Rv1733c family protein n=1 Tax=Streptomyces sp. MST-110588 TaxID=2833628 RepID=UPI001F5C641B|nr:hypothetical protein [Streptomyces sp. MST-110588]UNO43390.1 hypothetical protein KGS77_32810 [Streptomyces sp. MST-110588]